ncbi:MAG: acylneuraminate cytidylyltransferase family protein [Clostridiales bacterium]|nr:acylneuraminate cytidylyltransferase family protein [Clostridiales bacterium]
MKTACFIPIKANSERVVGKNLRVVNGKKLYEYLCEHVIEANVFDDVYVDTNSPEVAEYALKKGFHVIERKPELAKNTANGNDLLVHQFELYPDYDYYFQLFVTAPYMQPETIRACYDRLLASDEYDSCFTATESHSFYWLAGTPINYRPGILPRSQDLPPVYEETTGLYGICRDSLNRYRCRIGRKPYIHIVNKFEAIDINTEEDMKVAEYIGQVIFNYPKS